MQDQSQSETWNLYKSHFTPVRLAAYEDASGGNERKAQQLYDWNSEVSGAFWIRIGHHHRIWSLNLEEFHNHILKLATFIDPDFGAHLARESRVEDLISKDPSKTVI